LRFGNPGNTHSFLEGATLKELRRGFVTASSSQLLQSCEEFLAPLLNPGFQSKPWAGNLPTLSALFPGWNLPTLSALFPAMSLKAYEPLAN